MAILRFNFIPLITPLSVDAGEDQLNIPSNTTSINLLAVVTGGVLPLSSILWAQIDGQPVNIVNPNQLNTQVNNLIPGETYEFQIQVIDDVNNQSTDTVVISVEQSQPSIEEITFPNGNCCEIGSTIPDSNSFNYDSCSTNQNDHVLILTEAILVAQSSLDVGQIQGIIINSLPDRGQLGVIDNLIINPPQQIDISNITSNLLYFWADNVNGEGQGGDFSTVFTYTLVDTNGDEQETISMTLNANDLCTSLTDAEGVIKVLDCSTPDGTNIAIEVVSQRNNIVSLRDIVNLAGTTIPYNGNNELHRLTENATSGTYYKTFDSIVVSNYLARIDNNGVITEIIPCN